MNINQLEIEETSNRKAYFSIIEALLFVRGEPLKLKEIASILECSIDFTKELMKMLMKLYVVEERGIEIIEILDGYQFVTKGQNSEYIQKLLKTNNRQSLSQASLETLAIIAYKQPVTRMEIDDIRGVKSDRALLTLLEKNLIKESGRLEAIGRPILYATTDEFLKHFGLPNLNTIPSIQELMIAAENKE